MDSGRRRRSLPTSDRPSLLVLYHRSSGLVYERGRQGIDDDGIIETVHARHGPMLPVSASLRRWSTALAPTLAHRVKRRSDERCALVLLQPCP